MTTRALLAAAVLVAVLQSGESRGAAAQPAGPGLFIAVYERGPAWIKDQPLSRQPGVREHVAYFQALGDRLIAAAPVRGGSGEVIDGLVMFKASSMDEANAWLAKDPIVLAGTSKARVVEWLAPAVAAFKR